MMKKMSKKMQKGGRERGGGGGKGIAWRAYAPGHARNRERARPQENRSQAIFRRNFHWAGAMLLRGRGAARDWPSLGQRRHVATNEVARPGSGSPGSGVASYGKALPRLTAFRAQNPTRSHDERCLCRHDVVLTGCLSLNYVLANYFDISNFQGRPDDPPPRSGCPPSTSFTSLIASTTITRFELWIAVCSSSCGLCRRIYGSLVRVLGVKVDHAHLGLVLRVLRESYFWWHLDLPVEWRGLPARQWWFELCVPTASDLTKVTPGIILANDLSGATGPGGGVAGTSVTGGSSLSTTALSLDHQQFNIFPAIFSRQLNFSAAAANCSQNKLMDELRPNLGLLGVGLVENDSFHLNHNQEKRKCSSTSSNEQDFGLYGVHQGLEASPPTPAATPGRSSVGASSASVGRYSCQSNFLTCFEILVVWFRNRLENGFICLQKKVWSSFVHKLLMRSFVYDN